MRVRKKVYKILLIVFGILCVALFITERVTEQVVHTQIFKMNIYDFFFIFLCLIGVGARSLLIRFWRRTSRKLYKGLLFFGWIVLIGVMILGSLIWLLCHAITTWFVFYSPDHKHSVIVKESGFLLLGDISPYERTSPILVRRLEGDLSTDDGIPAITNGDYKVSWDGSVVTLSASRYYNGAWSKVKLDMAKQGKVLEEFDYYPNGKPALPDFEDDADKNKNLLPSLDDSESEDIQQEAEQKIIDGLQAVALSTGYVTNEDSEITYTAKGTPELVISSDLNTNLYILYDRNSSNGKCALYVLYQLDNNDEGSSDPKILEMYAYEYSTGKVITADRHAWEDVGTDEYREATGE